MASKTHKVRKAILPVAGFGTRFLPATKAQPKEMLPIVDKPAVQYLVEEIVASGIEEIIFITGRGKRALEDHFDISYELEDTLVQKNKHELLESVRNIPHLARFTYVRQKTPHGDGDALLQAVHLLDDEPVLVIFGDCLYDAKVSRVQQMLDSYEELRGPIIGLTRIPKEDVSKFGVVTGKKIGAKHLEIDFFVEKPKVEEAPSNIVAPGTYILTPEIFKTLKALDKDHSQNDNGKDDELRLADAFKALVAKNKKVYGRILDGIWLDTGDKLNFLKATIHMGLKHPEVGEGLRQHLKGLKL